MSGGFWVSILEFLNASQADFFIFIMAIAAITYGVIRNQQHAKKDKEQKEDFAKALDKVDAQHQASIDNLWRKTAKLKEEIDRINDHYHQVDKLTAMLAVSMQRISGIKLIKQSADGKGDHALNRDVE